jgi:hypothetical protein
MSKQAHNKFLQSDQIVLSCLLQKAQKPRQHALAAEERRYVSMAQMELVGIFDYFLVGIRINVF